MLNDDDTPRTGPRADHDRSSGAWSGTQIQAEYDRRSRKTVSRLPEDAVEADIAQNLGFALDEAIGKMRAAPVAGLKVMVEAGRHVEAAAHLEKLRASGALFFGADADLLDLALRISADALPAANARALRLLRVGLGAELEREVDVVNDATNLLGAGEALTDVETASLQFSLGVAAVRQNRTKAALVHWRSIVLEGLPAGLRAVIHRNISYALPSDSPEALERARQAADAFLMAGDKREAAVQHLHICGLLGRGRKADVITALDRCADLLDTPGVVGDLERAGFDHERAQRFLQLREWDRAAAAAEEAVAHRRGLSGQADALASSLNLQAIALEGAGRTAEAAALREQARAATGESAYYGVADELNALMTEYSPEAAAAALVQAADHPDLRLKTEFVIARFDPALELTDRVARLEVLLDRSAQASDGRLTSLIAMALADVLRRAGQMDDAIDVLRRRLQEDPTHLLAADMMARMLMDAGDWSTAVVYLEDQLGRRGDEAELLMSLGQACFHGGLMGRAAGALARAKKLSPWTPNHPLQALMEQAAAAEDPVAPPALPDRVERPVGREDLERALREFAAYCSADQRDAFWDKMSTPDAKWMSGPETIGKRFLQTFLIGEFRDGVTVVSEQAAGAGRLDLWLRFRGGLEAIVELKMCGKGYSSTYAAAGEVQLDHYMAAKRVHLGYLVVFDGRIEDGGTSVLPEDLNPAVTIREVVVDLSPRVSRRRRP